MTTRRNRVLVAPLNWGLGHATRCIPVIRALLARNCEVILASDGDALKLLAEEFPGLKTFTLSGYNPRYAVKGSMLPVMIRQLPHFVNVIRQEHHQINRLVDTEKIDAIISDNRYGVQSAIIPAVVITHQLNLLMPPGAKWLSPGVNAVHQALIKKFTYCWVPDFEGSVLSGNLSAAVNWQRIRFIGPLSRFTTGSDTVPDAGYDVLVVLSGPEPQRTRLEEILTRQLPLSNKKTLLVRGVLRSNQIQKQNGMDVADYLLANQLNSVMRTAGVVIARSGYSTLMDLARLEKKAILIPTPGQTEQEYLAARVTECKLAYTGKQHSFKLDEALQAVADYSGFTNFQFDEKKLNLALDELLG